MNNNKPKTKKIVGNNNKGLLLIPYDRTLEKTKLQKLIKNKLNKKSPKLVLGEDKNKD